MVKDAYEKAKSILMGNEKKLHELADYLLEKRRLQVKNLWRYSTEKPEPLVRRKLSRRLNLKDTCEA